MKKKPNVVVVVYIFTPDVFILEGPTKILELNFKKSQRFGDNQCIVIT